MNRTNSHIGNLIRGKTSYLVDFHDVEVFKAELKLCFYRLSIHNLEEELQREKDYQNRPEVIDMLNQAIKEKGEER